MIEDIIQTSYNASGRVSKVTELQKVVAEIRVVKGECTCHQRSQRANHIELNFTHYVLAIVYLLVADFDAACKLFKQVREQDPCSLEHMDTYSNILYVKVSVKMF